MDIHSILLTWWQACGSAFPWRPIQLAAFVLVPNESILVSVCTLAVCNEQLFLDSDTPVPELLLLSFGRLLLASASFQSFRSCDADLALPKLSCHRYPHDLDQQAQQ